MDGIEKRLKELGFELPKISAPLAQYVPAKKAGDLVFVSGQVPARAGQFVHVGKVGAGVSIEQGQECARVCVLNALAAVKALVGSLDNVCEVVQVRGFVNCPVDFDKQPEVINGASELLVQVFGDAGKHARAAVGCGSLPRNVPVEIEFVLRVEG